MTENKRFNCHVKFSKLPNGIMVLDYTKKGEEQTVIEDISREKAHRVMDRLNELADENEQLKHDATVLIQANQDYRRENEQLKQFQEKVASVIESKMGDNVCNDYKMEVLKEIWNELNLDEVWFE